MASIYLIRHGQASFGAENYDQLSPLGQRQADVTGEYCARVGLTFDAAYSGNLSRQQETGQRVLAGLGNPCEITVDARFNEVNNDEQIEALLPLVKAANPEIASVVDRGITSKDYQKVIRAVFNAWVSPDCPDVGITSWSTYRDGVQTALNEVMTTVGSGKDTAIFTSGGTIATAVALVTGTAANGVYQFYEPIMNCSITRFIYNGAQQVSLSNFNDTAHLQMLSVELGEKLVTYR